MINFCFPLLFFDNLKKIINFLKLILKYSIFIHQSILIIKYSFIHIIIFKNLSIINNFKIYLIIQSIFINSISDHF